MKAKQKNLILLLNLQEVREKKVFVETPFFNTILINLQPLFCQFFGYICSS